MAVNRNPYEWHKVWRTLPEGLPDATPELTRKAAIYICSVAHRDNWSLSDTRDVIDAVTALQPSG
jgi:hypothetical protein